MTPMRFRATAAARSEGEGSEAQQGGAVEKHKGGRGKGVARRTPASGTDLFFPGPSYGRVNSMFREMEREMNDMLRGFGVPGLGLVPDVAPGPLATASPLAQLSRLSIDVKEDDKQFVVKADVPGLTKEDIKVTVSPDKVLTIKGEHNVEEEKDEEGYHLKERRYGSFFRRLQLPDHVDAHAVAAKTDNGVLTITIPKTETPKEEAIEVNVE